MDALAGVRLLAVDECQRGPEFDEHIPNTKVVYFIRHGQSVANVAPDSFDPALRDSPLTETGQQQATDLQDVVKDWNIQAVFVSPLTRTLQTACLAFEKRTELPMVAWPLLTECFAHLPESQGSHPSRLRDSAVLGALPRFPGVNLDGVADEWWHISGDVEGRLETFVKWLAAAPETRCACVAHWGFIRYLMDKVLCPIELELNNCTWIRARFATHARADMPEGPRKYGILLRAHEAETGLGREAAYFFDACRKQRVLCNTDGMRYGADLHLVLADFVHVPDLEALAKCRKVLKRLAGDLHARHQADGGWHVAEADTVVGRRSKSVLGVDITSDTLRRLQEQLASEVPFAAQPSTAQPALSLGLIDASTPVFNGEGQIDVRSFAGICKPLPVLNGMVSGDKASAIASLEAEVVGLRWDLCLSSYDVRVGPAHMHCDASYPI